jgi:predicted AlkP superfamily pyrophosphatase or phosphodiesterase
MVTKSPLSRFVSAALVLTLGVATGAAQAPSKVRKAVFIIVDGISADTVEKEPVPNLKSIAKAGGYTPSYVGGEKGGYSQTPTISAVGYNSMLTGTWVNKHNVVDNNITAPNYHYPTFFRLFKEANPAKKTAIFSSWLDNRTKLVGDKLPATGNIPVDIHYDGMELDKDKFPHLPNNAHFQAIDQSVAERAAQSIRDEAPDLSWVYLEYTDVVGHRYGDGPEMVAAVAKIDEQVGLVWKAIQEREKKHNEDWMIVVTTDHGRNPTDGKGHGGQSDRERASWIFTDAKGLNAQFGAPRTAAVDIMPSIVRFLNVPVRKEVLREVDGVPFIGPLSATTPEAEHKDGKIQVRWKAVDKKGTMRIWLCRGDQYKTGGRDEYRLVKEVPVGQEGAILELTEPLPPLTKIVLEAPHNTLNRWIVQKP